MKSKLAFVRQPDSIPRKTAFSLRCFAAILCGSRLRPKRTALRSKAASTTEYDSRPFTRAILLGGLLFGVMPIPCPHFKITIVKRSQGQSAVAGAAYQSGERLFSEYDQKTKFYNKKKELVHAEVMLPSHAPPGYADRADPLERRGSRGEPVELPACPAHRAGVSRWRCRRSSILSMIKEFCQEQFVSKGMIADFAIHDKGRWEPTRPHSADHPGNG